MNKLNIVLICLAVLLISGCDSNGCIGTEKGCAASAKKGNNKGEYRHALFVECMGMAAKIERKGDNDVSDIVDECGSYAYYQSNAISY